MGNSVSPIWSVEPPAKSSGSGGWSVEPPAKAQPQDNPITAPLSKATGIGPAPKGFLQNLGAGRVPGLEDLQRGAASVGVPAGQAGGGLAPQPTVMGNIGQFAGVVAKNPASQAIFGAMVPTPAETPIDPTREWQAMNEAIGATKNAVRIPKSATSIEDAVTMPARGLQKEGFDSKTLSKMSSINQQAAVAPKWNAAGQAVDKLALDATTKNVTLNPSKSALDVTASIQNPVLQERAVKQLDSLMQEIGIRDASKATPLETLQLRRALQSGARFGPNGDLSSLGGIRARLYQGVSKDLSDAVPGFSEVDQHYSDLNSAMKAINNSASKAAVKTVPTIFQRAAPVAGGAAAGATGLGGLYKMWQLMKAK